MSAAEFVGVLLAIVAGAAAAVFVLRIVVYGLLALLPMPAFIPFMSWRYLVFRRTNLIGIAGILVGVSALILILSIMTGFLEQSRRTVRGSLADIIITPWEGSLRHHNELPREAAPILTAIRETPHVEGASAHYNWYGIIGLTGNKMAWSAEIQADSQHGNLSAVQLVGIDVEDEFQTTELYQALTREPRYGELVEDPQHPFAPPPGYDPENDPERPRPRKSVVMGEQLLRSLHLSRGDFIRIMTAVPDPEEDSFLTFSREFVVAGTFRSGENEMDLDRIYLERSELVDFVGAKRAYNEVLVKVDDYKRYGRQTRDALLASLSEKGLIKGLESEVRTWEEYRRVLLGAIRNERTLMGIMLSLVLIVAGFTIFAILSMMVTEKRRDIGILTALGATPAGVLSTFLMIAFWDAAVGAWLGLGFGVVAALEIDRIERWLSHALGIEIFDRSVYLFDYIPSVVEPARVATIVVGAFLCALLFAAFPSWKAARLDPLDALRYE